MATSGSDERLARTIAVINGKGGVGKCLAGHTLVVDPVSGVPRRLDDAVFDPSFRRVVTWQHARRRLGIAGVQAQVDSGVKPTIRLTTASGRSVTVTHHHPVLLPDGWRRADEVTVGETLALPARMPEPLMPEPLALELVDLLAILVAEGSTTTAATRFSTTDPEVVRLAKRGAEHLECAVNPTSLTSGCDYVLTGGRAVELPLGQCACGCGARTQLASTAQYKFAGYALGESLRDVAGGHSRPLSARTAFRRTHDLDGVLAKHKKLPRAVWSLPTHQVARFLEVLWMCDGTVGATGACTIGFASERLTRDVQSLLLRLGVQSRVAAKPARLGPKTFPFWELSVFASSRRAFAEQVPLWGRKRTRLQAALSLAHNSNVGAPSLTPMLRQQLQRHAQPGRPGPHGRPTFQAVARHLGWNLEDQSRPRFDTLMTNMRTNGQTYLSPRALRAFLEVFNLNEEHGWLLSPDLFWDPVVTIESSGDQPVYDLSVPNTACFIANDVVVHNTSITANVSGQLAAAGYRVLAVDLDLSGNLALDLGYVEHPQDTGGKGTVDAIFYDTDLPVLHGVRERLDVVAGGRHLEMLTALSTSASAQDLPGGGVAPCFAGKLAALVAEQDYDLVLLDCAPGNPVLQDMALAATRYVLIPTKTDAAGWDGLRMVGPRVKKARRDNPLLSYLGVLLFAHSTTATRVIASTREHLQELGDQVPVFESYIRHSETAAHDCRARGQLAHELARDATASRKERLTLLAGRRRGNVIALPAALSASADSLAGDYAQLTREILTRIAAAEQTTAISGGSR